MNSKLYLEVAAGKRTCKGNCGGTKNIDKGEECLVEEYDHYGGRFIRKDSYCFKCAKDIINDHMIKLLEIELKLYRK